MSQKQARVSHGVASLGVWLQFSSVLLKHEGLPETHVCMEQMFL